MKCPKCGSGWISVNDNMPDEGQRVICYTEDGSQYLADYEKMLIWSFKRRLRFINVLSKGFSITDKVLMWHPQLLNPTDEEIERVKNEMSKV